MRAIDGVTTRQLLLDNGLGHDAIDAMLQRGDLRRLARGTYLERGAPDGRRQLLVAALLTVGAPAAVTDLDALWVAGLGPEPSGPVDLLLPHPRNPTRPRWVRQRATTRFGQCGLHRIGPIPVVAPAWALSDVAKTRGSRDLARHITRGVGARWTSLDAVRDVLDRRAVFPGSRTLRRTLDQLAVDHPYSATERRLAVRCRGAGLPVVLNHAVADASGVVVARIDLALPHLRIAIEVDGPHHWMPEAAAADRVRDRRLQALGWTILRFTVYEVDEGLDRVVAEIAALAAAQRAA